MTEPRDDLPALDPPAAALLAAYRRERAMPPAARARVRERISGTCPEGHVLPFRREHRHARAWAIALAIAAVAILWFARRAPDLAEQTGGSATMSPAHGAAAGAPADASVGSPAVHAARDDAPPIAAPIPEFVPPPGSPPARREASDPPRPRVAAEAPAPANGLRDEQELLARGWRALAAGDVEAATRDADEHARRFPGGVLVPEQRALAAAAACSGAPERGASLARAFLAEHPRSPLTRRVREACDLDP